MDIKNCLYLQKLVEICLKKDNRKDQFFCMDLLEEYHSKCYTKIKK